MSATPRISTRPSIPDRLQDLLVREAAFTLCRSRIESALQVAQEQKTAAKAGRPLLAFLFKDSKKEVQRREMVENVSVLAEGLRNIDEATPVLQACIERTLEIYLREHDQEYANGLAASRFLDDWKRLLARFDESVMNFVAQLNSLKDTFEALPHSDPCGSNSEARRKIDVLVATARAIQDDISFVNKIADAQRIRAGSEAITLYRQPERNWKSTAHSLQFTMPGPAVATVILLLNESRDLAEKVRSAIQGECQLASYVTQYGVASYHQRVWASLREATLLRIDPASIEGILADTEEKLKHGLLDPGIFSRTDPSVSSEKAAAVPQSREAPPPPPPPPQPRPTTPSEKPVSRAAPKPPAPPPPAPSLRLNRKGGPASETPASSPEPAPPPAPPHTGSCASPFDAKEAADTVADLEAERLRLEEILQEERKGLEQREQYLSQSEERLLQKTQEQIEREMELEQREEQLRDLEKRLREKLGPGAFSFPAPAIATATTAGEQAFDEFKE